MKRQTQPITLSLPELVNTCLPAWPQHAQCVTQQEDGLITFWALPTNTVRAARAHMSDTQVFLTPHQPVHHLTLINEVNDVLRSYNWQTAVMPHSDFQPIKDNHEITHFTVLTALCPTECGQSRLRSPQRRS